MSGQIKDVFAGPVGQSTKGRPVLVVRCAGLWCSACHVSASKDDMGCAMQTDRGEPFNASRSFVWICATCIRRLASTLDPATESNRET
jgi:hypothetical protein